MKVCQDIEEETSISEDDGPLDRKNTLESSCFSRLEGVPT